MRSVFVFETTKRHSQASRLTSAHFACRNSPGRTKTRTCLDEQLHFPPPVIEHQLAHRVPDALGTAYNRTKNLPERKKMMQAWADYLDALRTETTA